MRRRKLGYSELQLTTVGLGTWAMGGGGWKWGWGPQDDQSSIATIRHALELGINWIDTAPIYGFGRAEEVIGQALRGLPERPLLVSKCSRVWDEQHNVSGSLKADSIRVELEQSLKRMRADRIDLYLMHYPLPEEDMERGWEALGDLAAGGKVRYIGASNANLEQIKRLQSIHPLACIQPPYSMLETGIETHTLQYCRDNNIGILAYSPMQRGMLTGRFNRERLDALPEDDHRKRDRHFVEPELSVNLELVEALARLAAGHNRSVAQLAIAWVLRDPALTAAIVGARSPEQIVETIEAGDWTLPLEDLAAIGRLLERRTSELVRLGIPTDGAH